jgi:uncharacterized protein YbdZ (MbtH family)
MQNLDNYLLYAVQTDIPVGYRILLHGVWERYGVEIAWTDIKRKKLRYNAINRF